MSVRPGEAVLWISRVIATVVAVVAGLFTLADIFVSQIQSEVFGLRGLIHGMGLLLVDWAAIIVAFALLLGFVNVITVHWHRIRQRKPDTLYSAVLVVALVSTVALGLDGPTSDRSRFIFSSILQPAEATLFALLAIFIATAAFRALRVRNAYTFFLVAFAIVILLGQVPVGIYLWPQLPVVKDWILNVPILAGVRGILLGVALGIIATGLRVLIGTERPYTD